MAESLPQLVKEPVYDFMDPEQLRLFTDDTGRLRLTIQNDRSYLDVKAVRAFPLSYPDGYIGLLDQRDQSIGVVVDPSALDDETEALVYQALDRHYFVPTIKEITSMKEEFGALYFDVDTDHGRRQFVAKGVRDTLEDLGGGELLFQDVDGNRYCIADWQALDQKSQRFLERIL